MEQGQSQFRSILAGPREAGVRCAHCNTEIVTGAEVAQCVRCGTAHHESCWMSRGGCGSYDCAPGRRVAVISAEELSGSASGDAAGQVWKVTADDLDRAIPLPEPRPAFAPPPSSFSPYTSPSGGKRTYDPRSLRMSRLAVAALVVGIAGIPLFGLVTGIFAIILGCIALSTIDTTRMRGTSLAAVGLLLGFVDIVVWIALIAYWQGGSVVTVQRHPQIELDPAALEAVDPAIADAMRANVIISSHKLLSERMGSGVVVKLENGEAHIVTNRHVIDASYTGEGETGTGDTSVSGEIVVRMLGQAPVPAKVMWTAPDGVDLAILKVDCKSQEVRVARVPAPKPPKIGDSAFAVGNPHSLGWSLSPGSISQIRNKWEHDLTVIQTTAPINSGNSGGGLYDKDGFLIGINTWTENKQVSEGLGFAISADSLLKLAPTEMFGSKPTLNSNHLEVEPTPTTKRVAP